jgi:hypothetical protein
MIMEMTDPANTTYRISIFLIRAVNAPKTNSALTASHGTADANLNVA